MQYVDAKFHGVIYLIGFLLSHRTIYSITSYTHQFKFTSEIWTSFMNKLQQELNLEPPGCHSTPFPSELAFFHFLFFSYPPSPEASQTDDSPPPLTVSLLLTQIFLHYG